MNINKIIFKEKQIFLNNKNFLTKDTDNYLKNLSELDLRVRNVSNLNEYLEKINIIPFSSEEKELLIKLSNEVDTLIIEKDILDPKLTDIKWYFIKSDISYENALPHTRQYKNIVFIVLSDKVLKYDLLELKKTLLHEKVHVYQKIYPEETEEYIKKIGFTKVGLRKNIPNIRANPDVNQFIYKKDNIPYYRIYKMFPKNISDTYSKSKYEDPREQIAYTMEDLL